MEETRRKFQLTAFERLDPTVSASATVVVEVSDVQDNIPQFERDSYFAEIREDAPVRSLYSSTHYYTDQHVQFVKLSGGGRKWERFCNCLLAFSGIPANTSNSACFHALWAAPGRNSIMQLCAEAMGCH